MVHLSIIFDAQLFPDSLQAYILKIIITKNIQSSIKLSRQFLTFEI